MTKYQDMETAERAERTSYWEVSLRDADEANRTLNKFKDCNNCSGSDMMTRKWSDIAL